MRLRARSGWVLATAVLGVLAAVAAVLVARTSSPSPGPSAAPSTAAAPSPAQTRARQAVDGFFETYVQPDGRVARIGQAGDTVSEGQAYALLMAAGTGDRDRFDRVWTWTRDNLRQENGLLAWLWADGAVVDPSAAADADLYAAAALTLAAQRFGGDGAIDYRAEATALSEAIFAGTTVVLGSSRVLVAGPWATRSRVVNPSYLATPVMSIAYSLRHDERWLQLESSSRAILDSLTATDPGLPPDWAVASADGRSAVPRAASDGTPPRYGWDAGRIPIQLAVDCDAGGRRIGARPWPFLDRTLAANGGTLVGAYSLAGAPVTSAEPPSALVGAAGAAAAAGERAAAARLLDAAVELDRAAPSYFGAAWVALGRLWLDTDLLGGCRSGAPTG